MNKKLRTVSESIINEADGRDVSSLSEEEKGEIWAAIGGTPHLFDNEQFMTWMEEGEVPDGLTFGALEIVRVGEILQKLGINGDAKGKW